MRTEKQNSIETIYAPATPVGGAIAVIRVSGPLSGEVALALTGKNLADDPGRMRHVALSYEGTTLDDAMGVFFRGPRSYTGEDMLELHCHGGPRTVGAVLSALSKLGLRPAEGGEFTRRAFLAGKLDLSQAEAVMDLIGARAEASARSALSQLRGSVREEIARIESGLLDALSGADAAIDYPEELEEDVLSNLPQTLQSAAAEIEALAASGRAGRVLREGVAVAILGRPNAGKSSLMNALLRRDRAIVTDLPGTTRDILEEEAVIGGLPVRLMDTAGIREGADEAEREGVRRALAAVGQADIVLILLDGSAALTDEDMRILSEFPRERALLLRTKSDLPAAWETLPDGAVPLPISAHTGTGLPELRDAIAHRANAEAALSAGITNERHTHALERAGESLRASIDALDLAGLDCAMTDLREALRHLGAITGRDVDGDVIDRIFERFCVGK